MTIMDTNAIILAGNLCKDAEVINLKKNDIARFGIFLNAPKKDGQDKPDSVIVNFEKFVKKDDTETIELLKKGKTVMVKGFMAVDAYTDKNGQRQVKMKFVATEIAPYTFTKKEDGKEK